jgi:transcriptional regulator with XRE-family HTH domain
MAKPPPELYRWSVNEISALCGVSLKTAQRWKAGHTVPPASALALLEGDLGVFDPGWAGWRIKGPELIPPFDAWPIRRDDALAVPLMHRQIAALRARITELEHALDEARSGRSEQPEPGSWIIKLG